MDYDSSGEGEIKCNENEVSEEYVCNSMDELRNEDLGRSTNGTEEKVG